MFGHLVNVNVKMVAMVVHISGHGGHEGHGGHDVSIPYNCHFFTLTQFLENKIYTQKTRKLRQNTQ